VKRIKVFAILFIFSGLYTGFKKNNEVTPNNNEVKATVVTSTGTININASGSKATMGCSPLGGGSFVNGSNDANTAVYISYVYNTGTISCVSSPGTYNFSCEYRKNITDPNTSIYSNNGNNRGSITFTAINGSYMEGYFNAVCRLNTDSVIVTGTFKGDHIN
jgi:hypothetical protein